MKVIQKRETFIYIPERFVEFFKVEIAGVLVRGYKEGERILPFYLPVYRPNNKDAYECWILPLAPFVWLIYLFGSILLLIWMDMQQLLRMIAIFINRESV